MKMKQTHAQRLGAQLPPPGKEHNTSVLMTAAVRRMLLDDPVLQDTIETMAEKDTHGEEPEFSIHHRLEETPSQNVVTRWFPDEIHPIAMTEEESFYHYGSHQQQQPQQDTKASTGWGWRWQATTWDGPSSGSRSSSPSHWTATRSLSDPKRNPAATTAKHTAQPGSEGQSQHLIRGQTGEHFHITRGSHLHR